jgi:hypothetical protein
MHTSPSIRRTLSLTLALVLLLALLPGTAAAAERSSGGTTVLATVMTGAEEAPGPGDPDGIGVVILALKPSTGQVCWFYSVRRVDPIAAAHIHLAPVGSPGAVVVPLGASGNRSFSIGCASAAPAVVAAIVADPDAYYVNVHNAAFPSGALRGQLD